MALLKTSKEPKKTLDECLKLTEELKSFNTKNFKSIQDFNDLQLLQKELEMALIAHERWLKAFLKYFEDNPYEE
jgi:hypothetical protein